MEFTFENALSVAQSPVTDFEANKRHFLSPTYQESEVRKDFIDKFLIALGWDVNHDRQKNPVYQRLKNTLITPQPFVADVWSVL